MNWSTALPEWEKHIVTGESMVPCQPLFPDEAKAALDVFKELRIVDAVGQPTFGESGDQWVLDFVAAVFGAYDPVAGERLINEFFLSVAKKNGKSTIAGGIMITALVRNWRHSNELIIVAPTIKAADNSFKPAADMVRAHPDLSRFLHIQDHLRQITHMDSKATLRVLAADTGTVAGNKAAFVLVDELWEFGAKANADSMMREAAGGLVARPEGFLISITTQSDNIPAGVFKDKLGYARDVRDGRTVDRKFMPVIYEFPRSMIASDAYLDPANFYITNPHLGRSDFGRKWIKAELAKELAKGPETRNVFLAKHLNVEIGMNLAADRWPGAEFWGRREDASITKQSLLERCDVIVVGVDGGGLDDLFGLNLLGRDRDTRDWLSWTHAWCHEGVLARRKTIAAKLRDFEKAGELTIVDDELADLSEIVAVIVEVRDAGLLGAVAVDPAGLGELIEELAAAEITQENDLVIGVPQGYAMMNAIKTAERKLANGTLRHSRSALMDWAVGNLKIEPTATAIRATKQNAGDAKIDPVMALFDSAQVMVKNPEPHRIPTYELFLVA